MAIGRPRIHKDHAARIRAYRQRKRALAQQALQDAARAQEPAGSVQQEEARAPCPHPFTARQCHPRPDGSILEQCGVCQCPLQISRPTRPYCFLPVWPGPSR